MGYEFTTQWFADSELKRLLPTVLSPTAENRILEIGSYEGQSTVYMADIYCAEHPGSSITTVDPFDLADTSTTVTSETEKRFLANVKASPQASKIIVRRQYSDDFFNTNSAKRYKGVLDKSTPELQSSTDFRNGLYNFIYVDGSHNPMQIQRDASNAFRLLDVGGVLWFDDYLGGPPGDPAIRLAIDFWVRLMGTKLRTIHRGYQLGLMKLAK